MEKDNKNNDEGKPSFIRIKKEDHRMLLVAIIMIGFLIFMSYERLFNPVVPPQKTKQETNEEEDAMKLPSLRDMTSLESLEKMMAEMGVSDNEDFTYIIYSPNDSFSFSYPSNWIIVKEGGDEDKTEEIETHFIAYSSDITHHANIILFSIEASTKEEAVEKIKKLSQENEEEEEEEEEIEVIEEEEFVIKIQKKDGKAGDFISWQRLIFIDNICYVLSFNFSKEHESRFKDIKDFIFSSVQITKK